MSPSQNVQQGTNGSTNRRRSSQDMGAETEDKGRKRQKSLDGREQGPRFTFGIIADIQYADVPDGFSYKGVPRYYRRALEVARDAAEHFEREKVSIVLNLGDTVDGKCQELEKYGGEKLPDGVDAGLFAVDAVLGALSPYKHGPIIHVYGNHELYNLDRSDLGQKLGIPFVKEPCGDLVGYRSVSHNGIRFVVLDTYDVGILRRAPDTSQKWKEATKILASNNPNFSQDNINSPNGLDGVQRRYVAFNGGIDRPQLEWLRKTLEDARKEGEKVVVLSHQPILPGSSSPLCLVWNYPEVVEILRDFKDVVVVSFSGHAHEGGYKRDDSGIHFRVVQAVLETPPPAKTYGMVDVYDDRLVLRGFGRCDSAEYDFSHTTMENAIAVNGVNNCTVYN